MTIVERAAYLKGLTEGVDMDPNSREGKLWSVLTGLLSDMAHQVEELQEKAAEQDEVLDDVYEQLIYLQEITLATEQLTDYDDEDYETDFDDIDEIDDLYRPSLRLYESDEGEAEPDDGEDEELDFDGVLYDVTCPNCGETITFDEETLDRGSIRCPSCGETLEFDLGGDEE